LPEVPTITEAGVAGYEAVQWYGVLAPAGTPGQIVNRLHTQIVRASVRAPARILIRRPVTLFCECRTTPAVPALP
jgi:hypothetical protein